MMNLHADMPVFARGIPLKDATAALILIHGRGDSATGILGLLPYLDAPGFAYLAPDANGGQWYPGRFMIPRAQNQPWLDSALAKVGAVLAEIEAAGIAPERTALLGFSQGACLALEYAVRHPRRYGGVAVLSGGVIGADDELTGYDGSLDGTPVFLGCSDVDFHIPLERVQRSTQIARNLGGAVTERIYPGMGHTINDDEIDFVRGMLSALAE